MIADLLTNASKYVVMSALGVLSVVGNFFGADIREGMELYADTYPGTILNTLWLEYRDAYVQKDGRTIDRNQDYITTSEGQSYSLLRSVWMDEKLVFDKVLKWTNNNLRQRPDDRLYAWKWGKDSEGKWDVLSEEGGLNSATDADQDIALALLMAHKRWNDEYYYKEAIKLLNDIWEKEVVIINGKPYLVAGNWAVAESYPTINPSYFSPAAYPIFADADPDPAHDWLALRETSYDVLFSMSSKSDKGTMTSDVKGVLPPDWAALDPSSGNIVVPIHDDKTTDFSDDALRVPWRVGLDYKWHRNKEAYEYLQTLDTLGEEWSKNQKIYRDYSPEGTVVKNIESNSLYGASMGYFSVVEPELGREVYIKKLVSLYNRDDERFYNDKNIGYYDENWIWFGIGLYQNSLPNLYEINLGETYAK